MLKKIEKELLDIMENADFASIVFHRKGGKAINLLSKIPKKINGNIFITKATQGNEELQIDIELTSSKQLVKQLKLSNKTIRKKVWDTRYAYGKREWITFYKKDFEREIAKIEKNHYSGKRNSRFKGGTDATEDQLFATLEKIIYQHGKRRGCWGNKASARGDVIEIGAFFDISTKEKIVFVEQRFAVSPIFEYRIQYEFGKAEKGILEKLIRKSYARGEYVHNPDLVVKNVNRTLFVELLNKYTSITRGQAQMLLKNIEI